MAAGANVELEAVPRAHHVDLGRRELHAAAGTVRRDILFHFRNDLALARRAADVRADILVGEEFVAELEHADFDAAGLDELAAGIRERRYRSDVEVTHLASLPCSIGGR